MRLGESSLSGTPKTWVRVPGEVEGSRPKGSLSEPKAKIVVYTALFGDGDRLWSVPPVAVRGAQYVVFTEKPRREVGLWTYDYSWSRPTIIPGTEEVSPPVPSWEQRIVKASYGNRKTARYYKAMAHKVLRGVDVSIWVDANVRLLLPPDEAVRRCAGGGDLATFKHPNRNCLFEEAKMCLMLGRGDKRLIKTQMKAYRRAGMPKGWGLPETRCLIRMHTKRIAELNEMWWKETKAHSARDQISLPFVCWKLGMPWGTIPGNVKYHREFWFTYHDKFVGLYEFAVKG